MIGDKTKHCIYELNKLLGSDKETINFKVVKGIISDGIKELDELIESKFDYIKLLDELMETEDD